jgi:hypothetical protein
MEADFNATNKIVFGRQMLYNARRYNLMSDELFSVKQLMADDVILAKVLFYDISHQLQVPAALASVDAANCYGQVSHTIFLLVFHAFGCPELITVAMLTAIQQMKIYLCTAFCDSSKAFGAWLNLKIQGIRKGNGAAPAGWVVVSFAILQAHKLKCMVRASYAP